MKFNVSKSVRTIKKMLNVMHPFLVKFAKIVSNEKISNII